MANFTTAEAAVVEQIRTLSSFDSDNCQAGESDAVFNHMRQSNERFGCFTDYYGGQDIGRGIWRHNVIVTFAILIDTETIESDIRDTVDNFLELIGRENRGNSSVNSIRIQTARPPFSTSRSDVPFVYIIYVLGVEQSMEAC